MRFLFLFVFVPVVALVFISYMRVSVYPHDVTEDYHYDFQDQYSLTTELDFKDNKLTLPATEYVSQTSLIKVKIKSTLMGRFFQPNIYMTDGTTSLRQYFEHGAQGVRYIDISQLMSNSPSKISFQTNDVDIEDQQIQLTRFENKSIEEQTVLVLAPHPDDAEIAAYGLYSGHKDIYVVTVTAGEAGPANYDEIYQDRATQFIKKGQIRTWNSLTVPMLGDIDPERILNLGFFDGTLKIMADNPDQITQGLYTNVSDINLFRGQNTSSLAAKLDGAVTWNDLVNNMATLLDTIKPDIIVAPLPALDSHPDHKYTFHALAEAIKLTGKKDGELYLYTNHMLYDHYPYGEMGSVIPLPPTRDFYFSKLYSHPMDKQTQQSKILALDAMNDLRLDTEYRFFDVTIIRAVTMMFENLLGQNVDYFRRSVRSNELFFVIETSEIYDDEKLAALK